MKQNFTRFFSLLILLSFGFYAQGQILLDIPDSPNSYLGGSAAFFSGCFDTPITGELVRAVDDTPAGGETLPGEACNPITTDVNGKIAVIDRGNCSFKTKVLNAQNAGAIAVVICNNVASEGFFGMADDESIIDEITIPAVGLGLEDCQAFEMSLPVTGTLRATSFLTVVWGDEEGQGDFAGGLNDWTTNTVSCNGEESDAEAWRWKADAAANQGSFSPSTGPLASPTACNGAMIFDSDFLDNDGLAQSGESTDPAFGSGPCPSTQIAELISPTIDLSNVAPGDLSLSFYQGARQFDSQFFVGYSIDGGETWTDIEINTSLERFSHTTLDEEDVFKVVPMTELAGESNVKIRFRMIGDYYYWVIDDVKFVEGYRNELEIVDVFYTPASAKQPASQVVFDPFYFSADVSNNGTTDQTNVKFYASVWKLTENRELEELIFVDSSLYEVIPASVDTTLEIVDLWTPTIGPGIYAILYSVVQEQADQVSTNNLDNYIFEVTTSTFSKDLFSSEEQIRNFGRLSRNNDESLSHATASIYGIAADTKEELFLDNITFSSAVQASEGVLDGNSVEVYLGVVSAEVDEAFNNFNFMSTDFSADGQIDLVGEQEYTFPDGSGQGGGLYTTTLFNNTEEAEFETDPIRLVPGTRYLAMTRYVGRSSYVSQVYSTAVDYRFISTLLFFEGERWYSGYSGGFDPVIRMELSMVVNTNNAPLPDNTMKVFPNPATNVVNAQFDFETNTDATVTLATLEGKVIEYKNSSLFNETISFNTANLAAGMYLMRVTTDEGSQTVKFLVQQP